jgi:hypothetical protein
MNRRIMEARLCELNQKRAQLLSISEHRLVGHLAAPSDRVTLRDLREALPAPAHGTEGLDTAPNGHTFPPHRLKLVRAGA